MFLLWVLFKDQREYSIAVKSTDSEIKMLGLPVHIPTNCVNMSMLTSLCLSFLIYTEHIIFVLTLTVIMQIKWVNSYRALEELPEHSKLIMYRKGGGGRKSKCLGSEVRQFGFKARLHYLLPIWPWVVQLTLLFN